MPVNRVIQVAVPRPLHSVYDYAVPESSELPSIGARVQVPFGPSTTVGVCVATEVESPHARLRDIHGILDTDRAIDPHLLDLANWMSRYYHYPLGEVLATMLPAAARRGAAFAIAEVDHWETVGDAFENRRARRQTELFEFLQTNGPTSGADVVAAGFDRSLLRALHKADAVRKTEPEATRAREAPQDPTQAQARAIEAIAAGSADYNVFMLEGVTGSGKTEVYLQAMRPVIERGAQVLVLVPEIALTPQTLNRFARRFGAAGMMHSNLTDNERLQTWLKCRSGALPILIGTRSAVFTPFADLGLIVVDEEHDSSYKQQEGLRYSARDLAVKRAQTLGIPLILGSATPSLESLHNVVRGRYQPLLLPHRAGGAQMPEYNLIDMRGQTVTDGFSNPLLHVIRRHLEADGQVIVFLNRRGFAPTILCAACGWQAQCSDCDARLTLHRTPPPGHLICHHCTLRFEIPERCGECASDALLPVGFGTQRSERGIRELFPDTPVYRIDRDTTRSNKELEARFDAINEGAACVMIGTQMLAKGHHFPNVTLVAIVNADAGLLSPDFRAPERTAQLIVQVAGRAGRAQRPGEVWIQSYQPDNPVLASLLADGYAGFAKTELATRARLEFPPIRPVALIRAESPDAAEAMQFLASSKPQTPGIEALGPIAAPLPRQANRFRFQLMLIGADRRSLHHALDSLALHTRKTPRTLRWSIDVDPYDTL